jgi:hypothetical protein
MIESLKYTIIDSKKYGEKETITILESECLTSFKVVRDWGLGMQTDYFNNFESALKKYKGYTIV